MFILAVLEWHRIHSRAGTRKIYQPTHKGDRERGRSYRVVIRMIIKLRLIGQMVRWVVINPALIERGTASGED